jgi:hypothetical protein
MKELSEVIVQGTVKEAKGKVLIVNSSGIFVVKPQPPKNEQRAEVLKTSPAVVPLPQAVSPDRFRPVRAALRAAISRGATESALPADWRRPEG